MLTKLKLFIEWMNEKGLPIPMARYNKSPSVSLSLLVLSATFVMLSLLSTNIKMFEGIEFWQALAWHVTSAVLYFNRSAKISKDGFELSSSKEQDGKEGLDTGREKSDDKGSV